MPRPEPGKPRKRGRERRAELLAQRAARREKLLADGIIRESIVDKRRKHRANAD